MKRITCSRAVAALALLAALWLAAPPPASAGGTALGTGSAWSGGWDWITSFWERLAALLYGGGGAPGGRGGRGTAQRKDAAPARQDTTATDPGGSNAADSGSLINPDGGNAT